MSVQALASDLATRVQRDVHARIAYRPSAIAHWAPAGTGGDCNAIALAKRQALIDAGAPLSALHLCRCWTEVREPHLVLIVDTDDAGPLVLDNRHPEPMRRQDLPGYQWALIEQEGEWFAVAD